MDSVRDSASQPKDVSLMDQVCQAENVKNKRIEQSPDSIVTLLRKLEYKDKTLHAQMHEMDRLSQEMRIWQQKAAEANEQIASMSRVLAATTEELQFIKNSRDGSSSRCMQSGQKARFEPYVSQIPVSVGQSLSQSKTRRHQ
jgi:hypothetical protein